jgi:hypothetical protein
MQAKQEMKNDCEFGLPEQGDASLTRRRLHEF